jgi:hypothetical protein
VLQARTFLQVPDVELDHGVLTVWKASISTADPGRSVKKAKWRQSGHKVA